MRLIDPTRTNTVTHGIAKTGQVSPQGYVQQIEHGDGSMDAVVAPAPIRIRMSLTGTDPRRVAAVADLEAAARHVRLLKAAGRDTSAAMERLTAISMELEQI